MLKNKKEAKKASNVKAKAQTIDKITNENFEKFKKIKKDIYQYIIRNKNINFEKLEQEIANLLLSNELIKNSITENFEEQKSIFLNKNIEWFKNILKKNNLINKELNKLKKLL